MPTVEKLTVVLATNNRHKIAEIRDILRAARIKVRLLTLADFPPRQPVVENKNTLKGNAVKKAGEIARRTGLLALADDTGLFIRALRGKPGVYSARFAGPRCNYFDNNKKVLKLMKGLPVSRRQAEFRTVAALACPDGRSYTAEGRVTGLISTDMRGRNGFGYDPIFYFPKYKMTYAEMSVRRKNQLSHRSKAFAQVPKLLKKALHIRKKFIYS